MSVGMENNQIEAMKQSAQQGVAVSEDIALAMLNSSQSDIPEILSAASMMTKKSYPGKISLCSIVNAKSGQCSEDCSFCAQSAHHGADVEAYDLKDKESIVCARSDAESLPVDHFGIVTSGDAVSEADLEVICDAVKDAGKGNVDWCASLGGLTVDQLRTLKEAGLKRFHHNLETAESFFPSVCTTHKYEERVQTLRNAHEVGLEVCSGGIFGIGESKEQRVEFAITLSKEKVGAIPMNFIVPIEGTPLADIEPMKPLDIIRSIAMMRMINPEAEVKVCAGRIHLRDLQSMIFLAGATGMMIGDLLTIAGRDVKQDLQMLDDLEVDYAWRDVD